MDVGVTIERSGQVQTSGKAVLLNETANSRRVITLAIAEWHESGFTVGPLSGVTDRVEAGSTRTHVLSPRVVLVTRCYRSRTLLRSCEGCNRSLRIAKVVAFTLDRKSTRLNS